MRLHFIVDIAIPQERIGEFKYCLAGFNCRFKDIQDNTVFNYNLEVEFDGDHEIGLNVMDLIDKNQHEYLLAYAKDGTKVITLVDKFLTIA